MNIPNELVFLLIGAALSAAGFLIVRFFKKSDQLLLLGEKHEELRKRVRENELKLAGLGGKYDAAHEKMVNEIHDCRIKILEALLEMKNHAK